MINKTIEIVGPCSKYINGKGWTTTVKIRDIIAALEKEGYTLVRYEKENYNEQN